MRNNVVPLPAPDSPPQRPPLVLPVSKVVSALLSVGIAWLAKYDQGLAVQIVLALAGYVTLDNVWAGRHG